MKRICIFGLIVVLALACEDDPDDNNNNGYSNYEISILEAINEDRGEQSLEALQMNEIIWQEARAHSQLMADGDIGVGTENINARYQNIRNSIDNVTNLETNVAFRIFSAEDALNFWLSFPSDNQIIHGDFNYTGVGVVENEDGTPFITQIFANIQEEEE